MHPCIHAVMKLSNDGDEFFGATVFCDDSPKPVSAVSNVLFRSTNRVEISILFLTLLS